MEKYVLSTDSVCDLPQDIIDRYGISVMPCSVILGDEVYADDGVHITNQMIFDYVKDTGTLPKTACGGAFEYEEHFKAIRAKTDATILHFSLSEHLSGCCNHAREAAENVNGVRVIDTGALSTGIGLVILKAADLLESGKSVDETVAICEGLVPNVQTSFIVDSLDYLYKGGRCSGFALFGANLLKIHPILQMQDGYLKTGGKLRGNMELVAKDYVAFLKERFPNPDLTRAFITHPPIEDGILKAIKDKTNELYGFGEIIDCEAHGTIACHCGKNTVGLLFINDGAVMK